MDGSSSFNGATSFQTWRPDFFEKLVFAIVCFNGATSFQTWRRRGYFHRQAPAGYASMGPRLFRRGDPSRRMHRSNHPGLASMGPRLFRRGDNGEHAVLGAM